MIKKPALKSDRFRQFFKKGGIAVVEEGVFAASNFLIGILLGRWLEPVDYGIFTSAYSIFLLLATTFYSAITMQPMLLFGSRDYSQRFSQYFGTLLYLHVWLAGAMSLSVGVMAAACWISGSVELSKTLFALAGVAPFITLLWLSRRAHYARLNPEWPLLCGVLYLACVLVGCYFLYRTGSLNSFSSLLMMGIASIASTWPMIAAIRPKLWGESSDLSPRNILVKHWAYGKWSALTSCMRWSNNYAYYLLLPLHIGMASSAALRAHMNLILPVLHINAALFGILIPQFASILSERKKSEFWKFTYGIMALYGLGALVFWALLMVFSDEIMVLLYDGHYAADLTLIALLGIVPLFSGISGVLESALSAAGRPKAATVGYLASMIVTFTVGWWLLHAYGVAGAGMGLLAASIASTVVMAWQLRRVMRHSTINHMNAKL